jgi:hypothetical protein
MARATTWRRTNAHHMPLTTELVARLNPAVELTDLASDVAEIGYPDTRP